METKLYSLCPHTMQSIVNKKYLYRFQFSFPVLAHILFGILNIVNTNLNIIKRVN